MKCKDCKFWGSDGFCDCGGIDVFYDNGFEKPPMIADNEAYLYATAMDDSGLEARIKTGSEFGCVLFKEKD